MSDEVEICGKCRRYIQIMLVGSEKKVFKYSFCPYCGKKTISDKK